MKIFSVFLLSLLLLSCYNDDDPQLIYDKSFLQKWELYEMTGMIGTVSGENLDWHETYIFKSDGTVSKTYTEDGDSKTVSGTYEENPTDEERYSLQLKLVFDRNDLPENLYYFHEEEYLDLTNDRSVLFNRQYIPLDGPGLRYHRLE